MASRKPYHGPSRKLVLAFDIGTTYSGVAYSILDPGKVPEILGVTRYPCQERSGGDSKIPSILWYDEWGKVGAVGAEALQESVMETAEEEGWTKVEWFKLHLRPQNLASSHITDSDLPPLPANITVVQVFADFIKYMYDCTKKYIQETHASGQELWKSLEGHSEFILSHPNGWQGAQQSEMRRIAALAGLVPNNPEGQSRVQFVTEGEASLHFCLGNGLSSDAIRGGDGVVIVDAGGGTVDLSAYIMGQAPSSFTEIATPECRLQGSVFVSRRARTYLEGKLRGSKYGTVEDVKHITECFDKATKLSFRNDKESSYIKFGSTRDKEPRLDIRSGQMKLPGDEVASFFEPSVQAIVEAIKEQFREASASRQPITAAFLVGGFAASDWLYAKLKEHLQPLEISISRPDSHVNKAVAEGAVSFYLDHFVSVRVARSTYGTYCQTKYHSRKPDHLRRSHTIVKNPAGDTYLPGYFQSILLKGTQVSEDKEFRESFFLESMVPSQFGKLKMDIECYKGKSPNPEWVDTEPEMFSTLCSVTVDTSHLAQSPDIRHSPNGTTYYRIEYSIILNFGLTEHKAQLAWKENGVEKRSPATIVYDQEVGRM